MKRDLSLDEVLAEIDRVVDGAMEAGYRTAQQYGLSREEFEAGAAPMRVKLDIWRREARAACIRQAESGTHFKQ